jgi:hypothetical protein
LERAINALKRKSITIHVSLSDPGMNHLQHRGSFISGMEHGGAFLTHAEHGMTSLVYRPTTFRGTRMGEGLNPNMCDGNTFDKRNRKSYLTTVSSGSGSGRGGGPIVRENVITIDGHIIDKRITKVALDDFGMHV